MEFRYLVELKFGEKLIKPCDFQKDLADLVNTIHVVNKTRVEDQR